MKGIVQNIFKVWDKYENTNLKIAVILMGLQIFHLYWLTTDIVLPMITGSVPVFPDYLLPLLVFVDYIEIPAIFAGVTFYIVSMRNGRSKFKNILMMVLLIVQILHIFWITDEIVYETFLNSDLVKIPIFLAWIAIFIDYLELPVIWDLILRIFRGKR